MAEVHLIAVEGENLVLGVALLNPDREERFLDLAFPRLLVGQKQLARELLRQRAGAARFPPLDDVFHERGHDPRNAEADVLLELVVLCGHDRLPQVGRDRLVGDDLTPLDRELADHLTAGSVHPRDGAWRVVVQRRDLGEIAGVREDDARRDSEKRRDEEERNEAGVAREPDDVCSHDGADCSQPILTPAAFERLEEFRRCFHADAVPQRREEVTPVIRDDHASPGGARHLGNVRVVDSPAGGFVLGGRVQKMQAIGRRQIVHGHPPEDLVLEQSCGIRRRQPELGGKPGRDREKLEATVPRGGR